MNDLPNLHSLEAQGIRPDGEVRPGAVRARVKSDVLPAAARVPEVPGNDSGSGGGTGQVARITVEIPVKTVSVMNVREHWRKRAARAKTHRLSAYLMLGPNTPRPALPCTVTLTRIAPRPLDDDNNQAAIKACRDGVADWFGLDDRDPRITWAYGQAKGKPKHYAVLVEFS